MIPAKGLESIGSVGLFLQYGILSVQIKPEFVIAANSSFSNFNPIQYDVTAARYYDIYNNIDLPVQFGVGHYSKIYPGPSALKRF